MSHRTAALTWDGRRSPSTLWPRPRRCTSRALCSRLESAHANTCSRCYQASRCEHKREPESEPGLASTPPSSPMPQPSPSCTLPHAHALALTPTPTFASMLFPTLSSSPTQERLAATDESRATKAWLRRRAAPTHDGEAATRAPGALISTSRLSASRLPASREYEVIDSLGADMLADQQELRLQGPLRMQTERAVSPPARSNDGSRSTPTPLHPPLERAAP